MDLHGPQIAHRRIYWAGLGTDGAKVINRACRKYHADRRGLYQ